MMVQLILLFGLSRLLKLFLVHLGAQLIYSFFDSIRFLINFITHISMLFHLLFSFKLQEAIFL